MMNVNSFNLGFSHLQMVQKVIDITNEIGDRRISKKVSGYMHSLGRALEIARRSREYGGEGREYNINTHLLWRNEMLRRLDQRNLPENLHSHLRSLTIAKFRSALRWESQKQSDEKRERKRIQRDNSLRWARKAEERRLREVARNAHQTSAEPEPSLPERGIDAVKRLVS